jgi:hypothetical protein
MLMISVIAAYFFCRNSGWSAEKSERRAAVPVNTTTAHTFRLSPNVRNIGQKASLVSVTVMKLR